MGQAISRLFASASREVKMINIEHRAEKVISKDKPLPAPMYPGTVEELRRLEEENVSKDYLHKKDGQLDTFLKDVYVTSPDPVPPPTKRINNPLRPLPQNRHHGDELLYGYSESEEVVVPTGRLSLRQALQFIVDHQQDPKTHTNTAIAEQYKLTITTTDDILEHFRMFDLRMGKKELDTNKLTARQKMQLKFQNLSILNSPKLDKEYEALREAEKSEIKNTEDEVPVKSDVKVNTNEDSNKVNDKVNSNKKDDKVNR